MSEKTPDAFLDALEQALEHDADPSWLGAHSPLAAPYFLGADGIASNSQSPGLALKHALRSAAATLTAEQRALLDTSFFKRDWSRNINGVAMTLNMSRAAYYRHRAAAIRDLADALSRHVMPSLRLETPPQPGPLVGRAAVLAELLDAARARHSIALLGTSGAGKSALGGALCAHYGLARSFWYTVRPGLNDQFASLAFALAFFLRKLGADSAWRQLVADAGKFDASRALTLIRHDLAALSAEPPLLCIDEAHLLQPELDAHAQLLHLLQDAGSLAPVVLIGQHLPQETQRVFALPLLDQAHSAALLTQAGLSGLTDSLLNRLHAITRGNPALLRLIAAFGRGKDGVEALLAMLRAPEGAAGSVSSEAVLDRLWARLPADERRVLAMLSVYADDAPEDMFRADAAPLDALLRTGLTERSTDGGLSMPAAIRAYVLRRVEPDERHVLHTAAADALAARGHYTQAAHHWVAAHQPARGIWLWFEHRERETELGHAASALAAFANVAYADLPDDDARRALALIRAEALRAQGKPDHADAALNGATWPSDHPATPHARRLRGWLREMAGQLDAALREFEAGQTAFVENSRREGARLFMAQGYVHFRARDMTQAARAALQARIEAEDFQAMTALEAADYAAARAHATSALALAQQLQQPAPGLEAKLHERLGRLAWQSGDPAQAVEHLQRAKALLQGAGDRVGVAYVDLNLSAAHIVARDHAAALACCNDGLEIALALNHAYLLAMLSINAAEAAYYLGALDDAERHALRSLQQEEDAAQPYAFTALGMVAMGRQAWPQAVAQLDIAIDAARNIDDPYAEACAQRWLAQVRQALGQPAEAGAAFARALELFEDMGLASEAESTRLLRDASPN